MNLNSSDQYINSKSDLFISFKLWLQDMNQERSSAHLVKATSLIAKKIRLSKHQHNNLQLHATGLQTLLEQNGDKQLDEDKLVSVLQGDLLAGEQLINDFDKKGNHQRPALLEMLNNFALWFTTLNKTQQDLATSLQQRPFRLSIG